MCYEKIKIGVACRSWWVYVPASNRIANRPVVGAGSACGGRRVRVTSDWRIVDGTDGMIVVRCNICLAHRIIRLPASARTALRTIRRFRDTHQRCKKEEPCASAR